MCKVGDICRLKSVWETRIRDSRPLMIIFLFKWKWMTNIFRDYNDYYLSFLLYRIFSILV